MASSVRDCASPSPRAAIDRSNCAGRPLIPRALRFGRGNSGSAATTCSVSRATNIGFEERYKFLLYDRDCIFAKHLDESVERLGIRVLKSPPRSPMANAICERVIGTIRRECLDWLIPLSESHLRSILKSWIRHYNIARPHMALGPGAPDPPPIHRDFPTPNSRHRRGESYAVRAVPILGGLHHEYSLASSRG